MGPADVAPTAATMNYAVVVAAGVWVFALGYWFMPRIGGRTFFTGPRTHDGNMLEYDDSEIPSELGIQGNEEFPLDTKKSGVQRNGEAVL
ncbi:hypothetical protein QFC22_002892 [Naganishia vaughanmartiniae]|uniref:Uncharacterized protein n=1 Tax=Naganishia vaughanmartiniae TaxID=1424756 RepID=A0ACC2XD11_9TREE|nr:hypothetical protein QFC22_002892 [Naganishia vaughanmartiniae]